MLTVIRNYIQVHRLLEGGRPVLVGLSGGADSVALLAILTRLGYNCVAAHCNFHLRGEESERDEIFAKSIAERLDVSFCSTDFDTIQYAEESRLSIEMAARELRYRWFEELREQLDLQAIAVAHHRDDSVETLLLNLVRGTGIRGMSGIRPRNGYVVRPLLSVTRKQIEEWLSDQQLSFVTDSTNLSDIYTRNFIRLRVLPLLEEINPAVKSTIARTSENLFAAEEIYLYMVEEAREKVIDVHGRLSISALLQYPSPATILYELLKSYNFSRLVASEVFLSLHKESGKEFYSATHRLIKDRSDLLIVPLSEIEEREFVLNMTEGTVSYPVELFLQEVVITSDYQFEKEKTVAYFDVDKLQFPLVLRRWKKGDWFIPFGMRGRKKISDYFTDRKFSKIQKEETWLLCCGKDVIWVVGERSDNRFRVEDQTKRALIVKKNN